MGIPLLLFRQPQKKQVTASGPDPLLTNLVAYWKLDEVSDGSGAVTRADSVGLNNLTDVNTTPSIAAVLGQGCDFEIGNNELLYRADNADLSVGDIDFSFSLWVKLEDASTTRYLLSKGESTASFADFQYRLYHNASNQVVWDVSSGLAGSNLASTTTISSGNWAFIVVYHDSVNNLVGVSINGESFKTAAWADGCYDGIGSFMVGCAPQSTPPSVGSMDGVIDEIGFWKRVLTLSEVQRLYNGGIGYNSFLAG